jgi:hypothetical protein
MKSLIRSFGGLVFLCYGVAFAQPSALNFDVSVHPTHPVVIESSLADLVYSQKNLRSPARQKMQSHILELLTSSSFHGNHFLPDSAVIVRDSFDYSPAKIDDRDRVHVYIYKADSTAFSVFLGYLGGLHILIDAADSDMSVAQAWLDRTMLDSIAASPMVGFISLVTDPLTSKYDAPPLPFVGALPRSSAYHRADVSRIIWPDASGAGIRLGVLSDDCGSKEGIVDSLVATWKDSNAFFNNTPQSVDDSYHGARTHEGAAMMDLVHDFAPQSQQLFATGMNGAASFKHNIARLADSGCRVITDDITYLADEPMFEDGPIAREIDALAATRNIFYSTLAGNFAQLTYTFRFSPRTHQTVAGQKDLTIEDLSAPNYAPLITLFAGGEYKIVLQWDDPFYHSTNNFNLILVDTAHPDRVYAESSSIQSDTVPSPAVQSVMGQNKRTKSVVCRVYVVRGTNSSDNNPTPRMKLVTYQNPPPSFSQMFVFQQTSKPYSILGHSAAANAITCGAVSSSNGNNLYNNIESYSSIGPVQIVNVKEPVGKNGLRPLRETRRKPDVVMVDQVPTIDVLAASNFNPFQGTSAAAPQAAGLAAQFLSKHDRLKTSLMNISVRDIKDAIIKGTMNFTGRGYDSVYGNGRADAFQSLAKWLEDRDSVHHIGRFRQDGLMNVRRSFPDSAANSLLVSLSIEQGSNGMLCNLRVVLKSPISHDSIVLLDTTPLHSWTPSAAMAMSPNIVIGLNAGQSLQTSASLNQGQVAFGYFRPQQQKKVPISGTSSGDWMLSLTPQFGTTATLRSWGIYLNDLP